jgi:hypothetical protein
MSVPASMSAPIVAVQALGSVSPIDAILQGMNQNPYFIGLMMLLLNLGGRFISLEVTKQQEQFLQLPWVRRVLIFTVLFVATRNLWVAFWSTLMVVLLLGYLFNENSALCLFGKGGKQGSTCSDGAGKAKEGEMTPEEKEILQRLSSKAQRYQTASAGEDKGKDGEEMVATEDIYLANLKLLQS